MLDDIVNEAHNSLKLNKINDNLYLTNREIEVLTKYNINYNTSIDLLIFEIEQTLNDSDGDLSDLEDVSNSIYEFNYYHNTNK